MDDSFGDEIIAVPVTDVLDSTCSTSDEQEILDGPRAVRRIVAFGGGKGGTGKSLLAANVAIFLATLGKRVVLLDADLDGANLHTFVGVERPRVTLGDLFEQRVGSVEEVVVETAIPGLGLISGEGEPSWIGNQRPAHKHRLFAQVQKLDVDYLFVDLGAGAGRNTIDFFLLAEMGVLVVVPEPTSIENTYRFIKSAFLRRLRRAGLERAFVMTRDGGRAFEGGIPAPFDLVMVAREREPALAESLLAEIRAFRPRIVINQARARSDLDLGSALCSAARRRLGITVDYLGHLEHDDSVWLAVRKRRPFLVEHPESLAAKGIERVARRLMALESLEPPPAVVKAPSEQTHYEVLETDPAATDEEIRRAFRRVREVYGAESLVVCGLYDRERLHALHLQLDSSYDVLMDAAARKRYDQKLFPNGLPPRRRPPPPVVGLSTIVPVEPDKEVATEPPVLPPLPEIGPETAISGALLRQLRESRGIDLHMISERTKIGVSHLRSIENERFDVMPAPVYVRGFLVEYAKFLRIDVAHVLATYFERYRAARADLDKDE